VRDVARDLLQALIALEDAHVFHLDLAPRNVLVNPLSHEIVIVDFEDAIDSEVEVECAGGSFGFAAPEQYLNYLGLHCRLTESFFVGAVVYHAFSNPSQRKDFAFPFCNFRSVPESLRGTMLALIGDPCQFYDKKTRLSARQVLAAWESGQPLKSFSNRVFRRPAPDDQERQLESPDGTILFINRRGLSLVRRETIIARWNGLVDVANAPARWVEPLRIGPLTVTSDEFVRSESTSCKQVRNERNGSHPHRV
jgi:serine/threonine protein kinase